MLLLRTVTTEAHRAVGNELGDDRPGVAPVARDVGVRWWRVRRADRRFRRHGVAGPAVPARGVMIVMTCRARRHCGIGRKRRLRRVAGDAPDGAMALVLERDRAPSRLSPGNHHANLDREGVREVRRGVALRAVRGLRRLMVADLTSAG